MDSLTRERRPIMEGNTPVAFALLLFNDTARMSRGYHCDDALRLSVCRWYVTGSVEQMLSQVFAQANADDRPNGRVERSASVGDVIIIDHEAFSIENVGFKRIALSIERGA